MGYRRAENGLDFFGLAVIDPCLCLALSAYFPLASGFSRKSKRDDKNTYHHLGIYCYQLDTLRSFVSFTQTQNELKYKLEQFRDIDNNIGINVALANSSPVGVDTKEDFVAIKKIMEYKS